MSVLSQDSHKRLVTKLHAPLPEYAAIAARYEAELDLEVDHRYKPWPGMQEADNPWRRVERYGHDFHLGGWWQCQPNWQNDHMEFRIREERVPIPERFRKATLE